MGYLVIAIFLLVNGLFLWVFNGEFNILNYGFADLSGFFFLAPWVLVFLIPSITMKAFSEEKKQGTLELLLTKPIHTWQLILGKYFGSLILVILAIIPTLLYIYTIYQLGESVGNIDLGATFGSYLALFLLAASFTAIGIYASTLTENQIVSFIIALFICFFLYFGFEGLNNFIAEDSDFMITSLGMSEHFTNLSRGVIDSRDLIYFISISIFFIIITKLNIQKG